MKQITTPIIPVINPVFDAPVLGFCRLENMIAKTPSGSPMYGAKNNTIASIPNIIAVIPHLLFIFFISFHLL